MQKNIFYLLYEVFNSSKLNYFHFIFHIYPDFCLQTYASWEPWKGGKRHLLSSLKKVYSIQYISSLPWPLLQYGPFYLFLEKSLFYARKQAYIVYPNILFRSDNNPSNFVKFYHFRVSLSPNPGILIFINRYIFLFFNQHINHFVLLVLFFHKANHSFCKEQTSKSVNWNPILPCLWNPP